jgi:hypothetical protein
MQNFKNIFVGFLVSFIGSIPLGYLNVVGFQVYQSQGIFNTVLYLFGVIIIEFIVIFSTLIFAKKLMSNIKILNYIEAFSVIFMFVLAYVFYASSQTENSNQTVFSNYANHPFVFGIILSCLNFIQIPFWLSWNLYLLNGKYIEISNVKKYFYVFGTIAGTFAGMLTLILSLSYFTSNFDFLSKYLMKIIIPLVFIGLGIFQAIKFYKKYLINNKS